MNEHTRKPENERDRDVVSERDITMGIWRALGVILVVTRQLGYA